MSVTKELFNVAAALDSEKSLISLTAQKKKKNGDDDIEAVAEDDEKLYEILKKYRPLLVKMIGKVEALNKLKLIIDNKRLRKPDRWWLIAIDKGQGSGEVGKMQEWLKQLSFIFRNKLPVARILKKFLDYGLEEGYVALKRILENDRAKVVLSKEEEDKA
jgi:hypothetical protein